MTSPSRKFLSFSQILGLLPLPVEVLLPGTEPPVDFFAFDPDAMGFIPLIRAGETVTRAVRARLQALPAPWVFVQTLMWPRGRDYFALNARVASQDESLPLDRRILLLVEAGHVLLEKILERPSAFREGEKVLDLARGLIRLVDLGEGTFLEVTPNVRGEYSLSRHCLHVGLITAGLTPHLQEESPWERVCTVTAALLHDLGKTRLPPALLDKPGPLADQEWELVRLHPVWSGKMLESWKGLDPLVPRIAMEHHEKADGTGYPQGLSGEEIHPGSLIVSVADAYDALTSERPYGSVFRSFDALRSMLSQKSFDISTLKRLALLLAGK